MYLTRRMVIKHLPRSARAGHLLIAWNGPNMQRDKRSPHRTAMIRNVLKVQNTYIKFAVLELIITSNRYSSKRPVVLSGLDRNWSSAFRLLGHHLGRGYVLRGVSEGKSLQWQIGTKLTGFLAFPYSVLKPTFYNLKTLIAIPSTITYILCAWQDHFSQSCILHSQPSRTLQFVDNSSNCIRPLCGRVGICTDMEVGLPLWLIMTTSVIYIVCLYTCKG